MRIVIAIDCDNAAFDVDPMLEAATILLDAATKLERMPVDSTENLYDTNGNRVGHVKVMGDAEQARRSRPASSRWRD